MNRMLWIWLLAGLLVAGYVLPYTVLTGVERWYGAFLFWLVFGIAVWLILSLTVLRWTASAEAVDGAPGDDR